MKKLRLWTVTLLLLSFIFLPMGTASNLPFENVPFDVTNIPEPVPPPPAVRDFFDLSPFYQQWINVEGFPVLASEKVSPYAVKETAWQIKQMIGHRTDILKAMAEFRVRFTLIAHNELTSEIPELRPYLVPHFYYNVRQRGGDCSSACRTIFAAEEHAFSSASVAIHEMAHGIHGIMNLQIDPTFDNRLKTLFFAATAKGLWHGVAPNYGEYWAEGVTVWFHVPQLSPLKTREALKAYDPDLALLIAEVFGDNDWRDTPIEMRTHLPHLQGFDPQSAPREVEWPPGVLEAYEELRNPAIEERNEWVNLPPYNPSLLPNLNELRNRGREENSLVDWTNMLVVNTIDAEILFYWVKPDGTETLHYRFPPKPWMIAYFGCRVGDLLLAKDATGSPLAVFQAVEKTGRALVAPTLALRTHGLSKVSGDNQGGVSGAVLANPFVIEVRDENLAVLEGISVTFTVTAGDGTLSVTHTTTGENGRAESTLTLGPNLGTNAVSVSAAGIAGSVTFTAVAGAALDIPDPNLRAAIEDALGKASGDPITADGMATLTELTARDANITDLTGLENATNLTELYLGAEWVDAEVGWMNSNSASNLTPLAGLTNLAKLDLRGNNITDISPLSGLTHLTFLNLFENSISNISSLAGLTHLTELWLGVNNISDISPLSGLTNLTDLRLQQNNILDLSPLAGLTNLTRVALAHNSLSNISALAGLTHLATLGLGSNDISDISPLAGLTNLTRLGLRSNNIIDISPVVGLTKLTFLNLQHNNISDIPHLVANTGLGSRDTVRLQGNPLNYQSIYTHIPALQNRGIAVEFDDTTDPNTAPPPSVNANGMVRVVYFLPNDRPARPDRIAALRQLTKDAQQFYAAEMHRHGFGGKTFTIETDNNGEPLVHQINGKFREEYYYSENLTDYAVWEELLEHFNGDDLQHVYFVAIDLSYEALNGGESGGLGGAIFYPAYGDIGFGPAGGAKLRHRDITQGEELLGGFALIPSHGHNFERLGLTLHELGHALGLPHDFRKGRHSDYVMAAAEKLRLSKCAAEWLSVNRFFNTKSNFRNEPGEIQLLSLRTYGKDAVSLRFKVTDPDGLYQAQLLVPEIIAGAYIWGASMLFDCKRLSGKTGTVESVVRTAELAGRIGLQIIDVGGSITWAFLPIELDKVEPAKNALDVNGDGVVNLLDLTPFVQRFGQRGKDKADVNEDGIVDIVDVLLVAAPISSLPRQAVETFTAVDVQKWLTDAKQLEVENENMEKGIAVLEYLLAEITLLSMSIEVATHPLKAIFVGHTDHVWSVAFSPDGGTLASGSWDYTIRLWNPNTRKHKTTLIGHTDSVSSVAFSPDGQTLASASWDTTIRLWNPNTGQLKGTLKGHPGGVVSVAFSPDGQTLTSGGDYGMLWLWNTTTWQVERTLPGHTGLVEVVVFSPDGTMLASGSRDQTIRLWNPSTGKHIRTLTATSPVNRLVFSPDGGTLVSGSRDGTIRLWNPHTGKLKRTLPNQGGWVNPVAFSPDGGALVIGNRGISLWDIETGQYKKPLIEDIGDAISVVFSPDGRMLASGSADNLVRLWDFTYADTLYLWSIPAGISLIHVPLKVTAVDGVEQTITLISDLYDALGGADAVNFLVTYDSQTQAWRSYFSTSDKDTAANTVLTDDTGILANMLAPRSIRLSGSPLGTNGSSTITLNQGQNLVGLPLRDPRIDRVSDLFALNEIRDNVPMVILTDGGEFKAVGRADHPGDIPITGGQGFILTASQSATVTISGDGWTTPSSVPAAPSRVMPTDTTPVLALRGAVVDEGTGLNKPNFRVTVKNLSTGRAITSMTRAEGADYRLTVVDIETGRAAMIGDILEISAQSPNPFIGVEPLRWTVTAEDVLRSLIQLPELVAYEIPSETELLRNYPNPFNPETWIPYRLAEDGFVTLTIYDGSGHVVRTLDIGHRIASVYESRSKAIHWDGKNGLGEQVASGIYFYTLTAGDFSATRRMVILK